MPRPASSPVDDTESDCDSDSLYRAVTTRGRVVLEASLQDAVEAVAEVAGRDPLEAATAQIDSSSWLVYADHDALDADLERGPLDRESPGWFAVVELEPRP
ncbi:MAG: hypothetical protein KF773_26770 [Deltaproteobacteria bacterium]|nr:hypothetical protein [Deltaproteobacteria bacterium]